MLKGFVLSCLLMAVYFVAGVITASIVYGIFKDPVAAAVAGGLTGLAVQYAAQNGTNRN